MIKRALGKCFPGKSEGSRFQVCQARTWKTRAGSLGPSIGISKIRQRLLERGHIAYRFSWLMQELYCPRLCKALPVLRSGACIDLPPSAELAREVWDSVEDHITNLHSGAIAGQCMPQFK